MKFALPATVLALVGAAAVCFVPSLVHAGDETARDTVEKLMPQLLSDDDTVRGDAERRLYELGEAGRAEMERVSREADPRRAITAVRLLSSRKWAKAAKPSGERRVQRWDADDEDSGSDWSHGIEDLRARMDRELAELRKSLGQFDKHFDWKMPDLGFHGEVARGKSSGSLVENDRKLSWTVEDDGRIKVTVKDGDAAEQTFEAKDLDELKKNHPDVAKRVAPLLRSGHAYVLRLGPDRHVQLFDGSGERRVLRTTPSIGLEAPEPPVLGVEWSPVPDVLRDQLELGSGGVVIESVVKDSLAEKLGLARNDVLVEVQGRTVSGSGDVRAALDGANVGEKVSVTVVRKGQRKSLEATK